MKQKKIFANRLKYYSKWIAVSSLIGVACGVASAVFLALLEKVTSLRDGNAIFLYLLPMGGLLVGGIYHFFGKSVEKGHHLIVEEFHQPKAVVPFRMAPLVLIGTLFTHLVGGSAGREGTAVQMGASIADQLTRFLKFNPAERRTLLMAGMSGGFGSVFGVPFAGTVFGLEVMSVGKFHFFAVIECAVAAFVAHSITLFLGIHHTPYSHPVFESGFLVKWALWAGVAGIIFGLTAQFFSWFMDRIKSISKKWLPFLPLRAMIGGAILSGIYYFFPVMTRYAGLGVPLMVQSLSTPVLPLDWLGKLVLTAWTLGLGFKGGEVTPLLFMGATLGNALTLIVPIPISLAAGIGFVSVFAGAAKTPLACSIMAAELFGFEVGAYAAIGCFASYFASGRSGIYHSQKKMS